MGLPGACVVEGEDLAGSLTPTYYGDNPVWAVYSKAAHMLGYDKSVENLENQNCSKLYNLEFLSVARSARMRGLGTQLTRVGEEEARLRGCGCGRVFTSSRYSARIFTKLGWRETGQEDSDMKIFTKIFS